MKKLGSILLVAATLLFASHAWAQMKSVRVKTANFREAPSPTADVLFTADRHYPVRILERKSGWAKVKDFEGEVAWVAERLLDARQSLVITVERAVVRDKADPTAKPVFQAEWSDAFAVKRVQGGWALIEAPDGKEGWVSLDVTWGIEKKR